MESEHKSFLLFRFGVRPRFHVGIYPAQTKRLHHAHIPASQPIQLKAHTPLGGSLDTASGHLDDLAC